MWSQQSAKIPSQQSHGHHIYPYHPITSSDHSGIILGDPQGVRSGYKRAVNQIVEAEMPQAIRDGQVIGIGLDRCKNDPKMEEMDQNGSKSYDFLGHFEPCWAIQPYLCISGPILTTSKKSPPLNDAGRRERRFVVGKCSYSTRSIGNVSLIRSQPVQIFCFVILWFYGIHLVVSWLYEIRLVILSPDIGHVMSCQPEFMLTRGWLDWEGNPFM